MMVQNAWVANTMTDRKAAQGERDKCLWINIIQYLLTIHDIDNKRMNRWIFL
jgi:hypothetical protein